MFKSSKQNSYFRILFTLGRKRDNGLSFDYPLNASYPVLDKLSDGLGIRGNQVAVHDYFGKDVEITGNSVDLLHLPVGEKSFHDPVFPTGLHPNH